MLNLLKQIIILALQTVNACIMLAVPLILVLLVLAMLTTPFLLLFTSH